MLVLLLCVIYIYVFPLFVFVCEMDEFVRSQTDRNKREARRGGEREEWQRNERKTGERREGERQRALAGATQMGSNRTP